MRKDGRCLALSSTKAPLKKERRAISDTGSLLHIVRHNHNGVLLFELVDQIFDLQRGDWVERGAGSSMSKYCRLHREGPGNAQPLLLPAGELRGEASSRSFTSSQSAAWRRLRSTNSADASLRKSIEPGANGDILKNAAARQRIGLLEDHANVPPHIDWADRIGRKYSRPRPARLLRLEFQAPPHASD